MDQAPPRTIVRTGNGVSGHTNVSPAARADLGRQAPGRRHSTGSTSGACGHDTT